MIIQKFERSDAGREEWLEARKGKITGTRLGDIIVKRGTEPKLGFWEIIAERVAIPADDENPMDRGRRLEDEAVQRFVQETGIAVNTDLQLLSREDYPDISYSPDGTIGETATVEVKCLKSSLHIKAWWTKEIPKEYEEQAIQPFCVNDKLETLYFVFYDPRMPVDFFYLTINRKDFEGKIIAYLEQQIITLRNAEEIIKAITF